MTINNVIIFPLFARDGIVNPTPWPQPSYELTPEKYGPAFFDSATGKWHVKQGPRFDGGWRWFRSDYADALTIYNVLFDKRAYASITDEEIVDTQIGPEFILYCAKVRCLIDHNAYAVSEAVRRYLERLARWYSADIREELAGLAE